MDSSQLMASVHSVFSLVLLFKALCSSLWKPLFGIIKSEAAASPEKQSLQFKDSA